jgi:hypothetical protein
VLLRLRLRNTGSVGPAYAPARRDTEIALQTGPVSVDLAAKGLKRLLARLRRTENLVLTRVNATIA